MHKLIFHIHFCVCVYACRHKNNIQKEKNSEDRAVKCQESTIKGYKFLIVAFVERKRVAHTNTAL